MKNFSKHISLSKVLLISFIFISSYTYSMYESNIGYLYFKNCSDKNAAIITYITDIYANNESINESDIGKPIIINLKPGEKLTNREAFRLWPNANLKFYVADLGDNQIPDNPQEFSKLDKKLAKQEVDLSKINLKNNNKFFVIIKPKTRQLWTGGWIPGTHYFSGSLKGILVDEEAFDQDCENR